MRAWTLLLLAGCYDPRMYQRPTAPPEPPCKIEVLHLAPSRRFREVAQLEAEYGAGSSGDEELRRAACLHGGGDAIVVGGYRRYGFTAYRAGTLIVYPPD